MNVDPPGTPIYGRPPSTFGSMLGRVFMLRGRLPEHMQECLAELPGQPDSAEPRADGWDGRSEGDDDAI